jgi:hypothetical protein
VSAEQRFCIKFSFKNNKTAAETHRILKEVFDEQALSQARTFEWFKRFNDGRQFRSNIKSILITFFFGIRGTVIRSLFHLVRLSMERFTARF